MADNKKMNAGDNGGGKSSRDFSLPPRTFLQTINPGYVVAGLSTLATSLLAVNKNFHKTMQAMGLTKDLDETYKDEMKLSGPREPVSKESMANKFKEIAENIRHENGSGKTEEEVRQLTGKALRKQYSAFEKGLEETVGVTAGFLKRPIQKFSKLPDFYKGQIAGTVITVTSVALGAVYSYARERHLTNQLNREIARRNTDNSPGM